MGNHVILFPYDFVPFDFVSFDYLGNHVVDKF
jgi:hypothetical protein